MPLKTLLRWARPDPQSVRAQHLYAALVAEARNPFLYEQCGIPDTMKGRSEAVLLLLFLHVTQMRRSPQEEYRALVRPLTETFVTDMDRSLREMGIGDTGVGKRVKRLAGRMLTRVQDYEESFANEKNFAALLEEHVYGAEAVSPETRARLADYLHQKNNELAARYGASNAVNNPASDGGEEDSSASGSSAGSSPAFHSA